MERKDIYALIDKERDYQDKKWGGPVHDRTHSAWDFALYMMKFLGKLIAALMDRDIAEARRQVVKVIALGVAALENVTDLQPIKVGDHVGPAARFGAIPEDHPLRQFTGHVQAITNWGETAQVGVEGLPGHLEISVDALQVVPSTVSADGVR